MKYAALLVMAALGVWGASLVLRRSAPTGESQVMMALWRLHSLQYRYKEAPESKGAWWTGDVAHLARMAAPDLSDLAEADTTAGPGVPYHGYYFRALPPPAGDAYAICAYPASYGPGSKETYFINGTGLFRKDLAGRCLGPGEFVRDGSWSIID